NLEGYQQLTRLITRAYLEGQSHHGPCLKQEWLAGHTSGLIALSGAGQGDVGRALLSEDLPLARQRLDAWMSLFPDRFYLELQRTARAGEDQYIAAAVKLADEAGCPVVATN